MPVRELASFVGKFTLSFQKEGTGLHCVVDGVGEQHSDLNVMATACYESIEARRLINYQHYHVVQD